MGHEFLGVVEDIGTDVTTLRRGDVIVAPFVWSDNTCDFCRAGLQTSCRHGGHCATDVVTERGEEGVARVRDLTGGDGTHAVLECVGTRAAVETAIGVTRDGGVIGRVGAPQYTDVPMDFGTLMRNITLTGGVAPARAYIEDLLPDVTDGTIQPGRVFDRTVTLDDVTAGYKAMADRQALKVLIRR